MLVEGREGGEIQKGKLRGRGTQRRNAGVVAILLGNRPRRTERRIRVLFTLLRAE